jgi:hypothetical protein
VRYELVRASLYRDEIDVAVLCVAQPLLHAPVVKQLVICCFALGGCVADDPARTAEGGEHLCAGHAEPVRARISVMAAEPVRNGNDNGAKGRVEGERRGGGREGRDVRGGKLSLSSCENTRRKGRRLDEGTTPRGAGNTRGSSKGDTRRGD